jgi:hypothetical protein
MTYKLYAHDELPAIICELGPDFSLKDDMENVLKELSGLLDKAGGPVYYVNDITGAKLTFGDIVLGMGMAASAGGVMRHPNLHELITVSASDIVKLGVKALGQAQYGGIKARIASSVDEALAFIQTEKDKV